MKLTETAIKKILEGNTRAFLCSGLQDVSYHTMQRWIHENKADGPLTTISALEIIKKQTGLTQEEILTK